MPTFKVDTHLFRELGQLLVGRDSTALVELIKNSYDADATAVHVYARHLDTPDRGYIRVDDDGTGMTREEFETGFLTIASRTKETHSHRSEIFRRRFTGAKGIGRLAAHKLARMLEVKSTKHAELVHDVPETISASLDWDRIESHTTFDELSGDQSAIKVQSRVATQEESGTSIQLSRLRRKWTTKDRERLFRELSAFQPPQVLLSIPQGVFDDERLFETPFIADAKRSRPFRVHLTGELEGGEDYWTEAATNASWILEIDARSTRSTVRYRISPSVNTVREFPEAGPRTFEVPSPADRTDPKFQARILIKEGRQGSRGLNTWLSDMAGIRVYLEGFRVLPYGEPGDDWLSLDSDYKRRSRQLRFLADDWIRAGDEEPDEGLSIRSNNAYLGAVFLTQAHSGNLEMLINREGFVPNTGLESVRQIIRIGTDLSVRVSSAARRTSRERWRQQRSGNVHSRRGSESASDLEVSFREYIAQSARLSKAAQESLSHDKLEEAVDYVRNAIANFEEGHRTYKAALPDPDTMRILSAIGTQMSAFVHEVRGLLGTVTSIEHAIIAAREKISGTDDRRRLAKIVRQLGDLRRSIERQAAYLTDISSADSRRRRTRQRLRECVESVYSFYRNYLSSRDVQVEIAIDSSLKARPMFPAELTLIISNLLSNSAKAVENGGHIIVSAYHDQSGAVLTFENTGASVNLSDAEKWFQPFESTSVELDPALGQGMGMGLPIVRSMLDQYGGTVQFVPPTPGYATAIRVWLPES